MVEPDSLREIMRQWACGVTIVATQTEGRRLGMTVSSFTSISLDPPLILVSLENHTQTKTAIEENDQFTISILSSAQSHLADRFAGRVDGIADRFAIGQSADLDGLPIIPNALAYLVCTVEAIHPAGTHSVIIGRVQKVKTLQEGSPLLYYNRNYRQLAA